MIEETPEAITAHFSTLRKRSGLTLSELAKRLGYRGASSLQRYENPTAYRGGYLRDDLIRKLEGCLVGMGKPPIEAPEVIELGGPLYERLRSDDRNHGRSTGNILHVRLSPAGTLIEAGHWTLPADFSPLLSQFASRLNWFVSLDNPKDHEVLLIDREVTVISEAGTYAICDVQGPGGLRVETVATATESPSSNQLLRTDVLGKVVAKFTLL